MLATMTCTVSALCRQKAVHADGGRGQGGFKKSSPEQAIPEMRLEGRARMANKQRKGGHCRQDSLRGKSSRARRMIQYAGNDRQFPVLNESVERGKSSKEELEGSVDWL